MENNYDHIDEVIARVLSNEATPDDHALLDQWISLSPENATTFARSRKIFEESAALRNTISVNTDKAWEKLKSRMDAKVIPIQTTTFRKQFIRIAAMLLLGAGIGATAYFMFRQKNVVDDQFIATTDVIKNDTLPDGSSVTLNRNSSISYASADFGKKRIVRLKGEAFFDVKHDDTRVFIVEAGDLKIEDVGTTFNIKALLGSRIIIVAVETGEVKIMASADKSLNLVAGEMAEYNSDTKTFTKGLIEDKNLAAYKDRVFIFDNTELKVIVKLLNDVYNNNIVVEDSAVGDCRITASFNNETVENIVDVIAETLRLEVVRTESEILIRGHECR